MNTIPTELNKLISTLNAEKQICEHVTVNKEKSPNIDVQIAVSRHLFYDTAQTKPIYEAILNFETANTGYNISLTPHVLAN